MVKVLPQAFITRRSYLNLIFPRILWIPLQSFLILLKQDPDVRQDDGINTPPAAH